MTGSAQKSRRKPDGLIDQRTYIGVVEGIVFDEDGWEEPITIKLTDEEMADEEKRPEWVVEIFNTQQRILTNIDLPCRPGREDKRKWTPAADFKKNGITLPVDINRAIEIAKKRQSMRTDFTYRVRNIRTGAIIMAAVL